MSYQRPSPGRYYIYMSTKGLNVIPDSTLVSNLLIEHGPHGKANAKALLNGLVDFLAAEGIEVSVKKGTVKFGAGK